MMQPIRDQAHAKALLIQIDKPMKRWQLLCVSRGFVPPADIDEFVAEIKADPTLALKLSPLRGM